MSSPRNVILVVALLVVLSVVTSGIAYAVDYFVIANNYSGIQVYSYDADGIYPTSQLGWGASYPTFPTFAPNGDLYYAELGGGYVQQYQNQSGTFTLTNSIAVSNPYGVAVGADGNLYITNEDWPNGVGGFLKYNGTSLTTLDDTHMGITVTDVHRGGDDKLYVGTSGGWLHIFDVSTDPVTRTAYNLEVNIGGMGFGPDANSDGWSDLYVCGSATGWIKIFNPRDGSFIGDYLAAGTVTSVGDIVFTADASKCFFTSPNENKVYSYDGLTVMDETSPDVSMPGFRSLSFPLGIALTNSFQPIIPGPRPIKCQVTLTDFTAGSLWTMAVGVEIKQGASLVSRETIPLDASGYFTTSPVAPGTYDISVKAAQFLRKVVTGVVLDGTQTVTLSPVILINGDLDGDNEVTSTDLSVGLSNMDLIGQ